MVEVLGDGAVDLELREGNGLPENAEPPLHRGLAGMTAAIRDAAGTVQRPLNIVGQQ